MSGKETAKIETQREPQMPAEPMDALKLRDLDTKLIPTNIVIHATNVVVHEQPDPLDVAERAASEAMEPQTKEIVMLFSPPAKTGEPFETYDLDGNRLSIGSYVRSTTPGMRELRLTVHVSDVMDYYERPFEPTVMSKGSHEKLGMPDNFCGYLVTHPRHQPAFSFVPLEPADKAAGFTEEPLYRQYPPARVAPSVGAKIIANGSATLFRTWGDSGPEWNSDRGEALQFARREDAERFCAEDLDAWLILDAEEPVPRNEAMLAEPAKCEPGYDPLVLRSALQDCRDKFQQLSGNLPDGFMRRAATDGMLVCDTAVGVR